MALEARSSIGSAPLLAIHPDARGGLPRDDVLMDNDTLRGELERSFEFEELSELSREILGMSPDDIGGAGSKADFARALVERCFDLDAVEALLDAAEASKPAFDKKVRDAVLRSLFEHQELLGGSTFGAYTISRKIGQGPVGTTYVAKVDGKEVVLKILRPDVMQSRRAYARFKAACKLVARVEHEGLPSGLTIGEQDGLAFVARSYSDVQSIAARTARSGPMHINEARPILRSVLEVLEALHEQRLIHGNVKVENVLLERSSEGGRHRVVLTDACFDRLRTLRGASVSRDVFVVMGEGKGMAPEQIRGERSDARTDVYGFGALMYEVLTGKPLFPGLTGADVAAAHLASTPEPASAAAPRGWVSREVSDFVMALVAREPAQRPKDVRSVGEAIERLGRSTAADPTAAPKISEQEVADRIDALIVSPEDDAAASALDQAVEDGASAEKVADAFVMAAEQLDAQDSALREVRKSLLFRAARLQESKLKNLEAAERVYVQITDLDPADDIASAALEEVRKQLGKYEDVIEMLLARVDRSEDRRDRAAATAEIGRLYAKELDDKQQAVVAYAQAFAEAPEHDEYAEAIEQYAGNDATMLGDAIGMFVEATRGELPLELKNRLYLRVGNWQAKKLGRPDAALPCYQQVIATEPSNDAALEGMAGLFRALQQYGELGQVLMRRAEVATTTAKARELRFEAAELLEARLNEPLKAKELYEHILAADPSHERALEALLRIYDKESNAAGTIKLLDRKLETMRGKERADVLVRIAQIHERQKDFSEAVERYEAAVVAVEGHTEALKALDAIYTRSGHFKELLKNLERQSAVASTPRQKISLYERSASIWEQEFLDHEQAAKSLEQILQIDPANSGALAGLAKHYRALDRWSEVASVYERDLKVTTEKERRLELLLTLARVEVEQLGNPAKAIHVYEEVLEVDSQHAGALEALAHLREQSGDAQAAIKAIETLAEKATMPKEKAEQLIRAAKLLEGRGDREGAIDRYRLALDAYPQESSASAALRALYLERGDAALAIELVSREIEYAEAPVVKARLCAESAKLARDRLKDSGRVEISAKEALEFDPSQLEALTMLGDLAFDNDRPVEALHYWDSVFPRVEALPREWAARTLSRGIACRVKTDATEKALAIAEQLQLLAPDDVDSLMNIGSVLFEHGDAKKSFQVHQDLMDRFSAKLVGSDKAGVLYRLGESARRAGDAVAAAKFLAEAADMDPAARDPLSALAKVHEAKADWEEVIRIKNRRLDVASGDERIEILVEIGEICASKLSDRNRAAKSFVAALEDRPDDRKLLARLMQLYSEAKEWSKLVEVVLKLADFVDDKKQKAKYVQTAAMVSEKQLHEIDKAIEYYEKVIELDPTQDSALDQSLTLREQKGDFDGVERLLKMRLERATERDDRAVILKTFDALAELYRTKLDLVSEAIDAYEAAQMLEPDNHVRNELLAELYASNPAEYLDKAVAAQQALLAKDANRRESYRLLRRLYTEAKRADAAWCLCQALSVLGMSEPDEDRFFRLHRPETAAPAKTRLTEEEWARQLMHPDADPILSAIIALIEPAVLATRADTLENLGYDPRYAIDLSMHPYPMSQTIYYAAGVLGMTAPPTFQNINDEGGVSFLHAQMPSIVLGRAAFEVEVPQQVAAFLVARHLTYYRPGMYVRHLIPTGTGLKAWVFSAIKMNAPQFPISADLEGPVAENLKALNVYITGASRERLASLVSKLLTSGGALDLKRWVASVDLTADRAGLLVSHDLETAAEIIKGGEEAGASVNRRERLRQLVMFSVSESYFQLRQALGIGIDS